jgi:GGDEF domain-containing protein
MGTARSVRASIALAIASAHAADVSAEAMLKCADLAMYAAKRGEGGSLHARHVDRHQRELPSQAVHQN